MKMELLYLKDMFMMETAATVLDIRKKDGKKTIVLDRTVFYPQGGGQPSDKGQIACEGGVFEVEDVRNIDGEIMHFGKFTSREIKTGEKVVCRVDENVRILNSRLHTAGHVLDMAVKKLGLKWRPGKGFHFPQGPYVEYEEILAGDDAAELAQKIQAECNLIISTGAVTKIRYLTEAEAKNEGLEFPEWLGKDENMRLVCWGGERHPCGGTHVADLKDVDKMEIKKIKTEKNRIRVSYLINNH